MGSPLIHARRRVPLLVFALLSAGLLSTGLLTAATCTADLTGDLDLTGGGGPPDSACGPPILEQGSPAALSDGARELVGSEIEPLRVRIVEIDRAFSANSVDVLRAAMAADAETPRRTLEREFTNALGQASFLAQETEIKKAVRLEGVDAVYTVVKTKLRPTPTKELPWAFDRRETRSCVYFFRTVKGAPSLVRIECWNERNRGWILAPTITCPSCPWSLPRPRGWFVVPREAGACAAFDSVSFVHPSLDVSIDFDCYASPCQESPRQAAERDQELLNQLLGVKLTQPAFVRREDPDGGADRRADLTFDVAREGVPRTTLFLRSYRLSPPFLFTFVARAESRTFLRYADEAMSIVDSLAVDDGGPRADRAGRIAKSHMAQGRVDGEFVKDDGLGIAVKGPCGWSPSPQPGVGRFCVRFSPPAGDAPLDDVKVEGPPKEGEILTPAGPRPETSWTIFAWEDAISPFGEAEVVRFFEGRRASMLDCEYQEWSVLRRESSDHANGIDIVYEVESRWRQQSCTAPGEPIEMREIFSAVPVGRFLLCAVARAPKDEFERRRREFERALGTLTHDSRR